jgi:DNA-binding response OmpR family regulator
LLDDGRDQTDSVAVYKDCLGRGAISSINHDGGGQVNNSAEAVPRQHTILLVDDDVALGGVIKDYLSEEDFEVIHVHDSMVALGVLETGRRIDLLLTDIAMPEGMPHGVSLALMARRHVQNVEILFMTGHPRLLETAGDLPGKAFVKPVDLAELTQEIRRRLEA